MLVESGKAWTIVKRGSLALYGQARAAAPLGPRAIVIFHRWVAKYVLKHKPRVRRARARLTVHNDGLIRQDTQRFEFLAEFIGRAK